MARVRLGASAEPRLSLAAVQDSAVRTALAEIQDAFFSLRNELERQALLSLANEPLPEYTVATRPTASTVPRTIIFVSDGGAGAVFQGSDGTSWVNLG